MYESRKRYFNSIEDAYKQNISGFISIARRNLKNTDYSIDIVHDAFAKAVMYFNKNPNRKVHTYVLEQLIIRACKKQNRLHFVEIPISAYDNEELFYE